ncbi:hypothetical protein PGTUg99_028743 [Puccinia graminis f. sp. tritici]|uniref:Uncharacterized protein n=1 Tax=Puccinia graminis f. sp. tritici TaxID=56615 RepID=A0A5B0NHP4_PUCGR|nr:hypothetical protein PGTUg99_028743 [Puccinia graminis f. sp. tritici]
MVLSIRVLFCAVLYATGAAQFVLSSLDAGKSFNAFSDLKPAESGSNSRDIIEPIKLEKSDQKTNAYHDYGYGAIPLGLEERKAEIQSMVIERKEIWDGITQLKPKSFKNLSQMKWDLEYLHEALRQPTEDRVYNLGGLEPFLGLGVDTQPASTQTHSTRSKSPLGPKNYNRYFRLRNYIPFRNLKKGKEDNAFIFEPLLDNSDSLDPTSQISTDAHPFSSNSFDRAAVAKSQEIPTLLESALGDGVIPIGDLYIHPNGAFNLDQSRSNSRKVEYLNSLQERIMGFKSLDGTPDHSKIDFQLEFLQAFFLLGDHIIRYGLLPSRFIDRIEMFKAKNVLKMVNLHVQLLFQRWGVRFFDIDKTVVPELEFLMSNQAVKHFHRSIKALLGEDQKQVVHLILDTMITQAPHHFPLEETASERFGKVCKAFRLEFGDRAKLRHVPDTNYQDQGQKLAIDDSIEDLIKFFQKPEMKTRKVQRRIEYQIVYYMLDFINKHYHPILQTITQQREEYGLLADQLKLTGSYLNHFRSHCHDPIPPVTRHLISNELAERNGSKSDNVSFTYWLHAYFLTIFYSGGWILK